MQKEPLIKLEEESASYASEIIKATGTELEPTQKQGVIAYALLDRTLSSELERLAQIYKDILANTASGQTETTLNAVRQKKEILDLLGHNISKCIDSDLQTQRIRLLRLIQKILEDRG
jgi:hypothetical protein